MERRPLLLMPSLTTALLLPSPTNYFNNVNIHIIIIIVGINTKLNTVDARLDSRDTKVKINLTERQTSQKFIDNCDRHRSFCHFYKPFVPLPLDTLPFNFTLNNQFKIHTKTDLEMEKW